MVVVETLEVGTKLGKLNAEYASSVRVQSVIFLTFPPFNLLLPLVCV
jgi:hypothetical protein